MDLAGGWEGELQSMSECREGDGRRTDAALLRCDVVTCVGIGRSTGTCTVDLLVLARSRSTAPRLRRSGSPRPMRWRD